MLGGLFLSNRIEAYVVIPSAGTPKYEAVKLIVDYEGILTFFSCFPTLFFCFGLRSLKLKFEVLRQILMIWLLLPIVAMHSIQMICTQTAHNIGKVLKILSPVTIVHHDLAFSSQIIRDALHQSNNWQNYSSFFSSTIYEDLVLLCYQSIFCFVLYLLVVDCTSVKTQMSICGKEQHISSQLIRRRRWILKNSAIQVLGVIDQEKEYTSNTVRPFLDTTIKWERLKFYSKFNWAKVILGNILINTTPRVDLNFKEGESILVFGVGENSGKNELLETLAGQRRLAGESTVRVFRKSMYDFGFDIVSTIGYLPNSPDGWNMDKLLTTAEALYWTAKLRNIKTNETNIYLSSLIDIIGIADCFNSQLIDLPLEQMRLVQIACAIVGLPKIIILNEPFLGLGLGAKQRILRVLADLKELNHTIVIGSTTTDEAEQLCDRLIVMYEGTNLISGRIRDLRNTFLPGHHVTIRYKYERYVPRLLKIWSQPFEVIKKGKNTLELYAESKIQLSGIYENVQIGIQYLPDGHIYHLVTR